MSEVEKIQFFQQVVFVDGKMVGAQKPLHSRMCKHSAQQLGCDVAFQQALAVLWKKLSDPTPRRRPRCPRTSGTADRTPAAPLIAAPSSFVIAHDDPGIGAADEVKWTPNFGPVDRLDFTPFRRGRRSGE